MTFKQEYLDRLKAAVEQSMMRKVEHASDFEALYSEIQHRTNEIVGISTLKRLWGYIGGYKTTRIPTLDVLCRFVGYPDWHTFVAECCGEAEELTSCRVVASTLESSDIKTGAHVRIEWNPARELCLLHEGEGWFDVLEAKNSKVKVGNRFHCERFTIGQPLYVDHLSQENEPPVLFVMGRKGGLTKITLEEPEQAE